MGFYLARCVARQTPREARPKFLIVLWLDSYATSWYTYSMSIFVATGRYKKRDGSYYVYYVLREGYWDKRERRIKQRYVGYIGTRPVLSLSNARKLAQKAGITLDELRRVRGLTIVDD